MPHFPGSKSKYTETMEFVSANSEEHIPVYRVMDRDGKIAKAENEPTVRRAERTFMTVSACASLNSFVTGLERKFYLFN